MNIRTVIWLPTVRTKLTQFRSDRYTSAETFDFIFQLILETEDLLINPVLGRTYTEEFGDFRGLSRIVIRKFRIYYEKFHDTITIVAVLFPGEQ